LTQTTGSQRIGISVVLVLFVIGLALLLSVDEHEGEKSRAHGLIVGPASAAAAA
jgi:MFS-type transporter involved in bile tolerance (Atg22 family)